MAIVKKIKMMVLVKNVKEKKILNKMNAIVFVFFLKLKFTFFQIPSSLFFA